MSDFLMSRRLFMLGLGGGVVGATASNFGSVARADTSTLRIGMASAPTSLDPVYANLGSNNIYSAYLFDPLVWRGADSTSIPGLAESWKALDETHWEFKIRPNVKFSNGSSLTAEDVISTIERARKSDAVSSYKIYAKSIAAMEAPDELTLRITTTAPDPLLTNSLSRLFVLCKQFKDAPVADFDKGSACAGTGAYSLVSYSPGAEMVLKANETYWGKKSDWQQAVIRPLTDPAARLAALLAGDVDLIESPPYEALPRVEKTSATHVVKGVSGRVVMLAMDQQRDESPFVSGVDGKKLPKNPLKDARVRLALAKAIDRRAIVEKVMAGYAVAASQFLPTGAFGTAPGLEPLVADPAGAKALLAEAGYPDGFSLTLHGPTDRDVNTPKILQAIAQMFTRIGVITKVEVMPWAVYAAGVDKMNFSVTINSWGINTGETSNPMTSQVATFDPDQGFGARNAGRYSNPDLDDLLKQALKTLDETKRNELLGRASKVLVNDTGVIFLHHEMVVVGAAKAVEYQTRVDGYLLGGNATKKTT